MHKPLIGITADATPYQKNPHDDRKAEGVMDAYLHAIATAGGIPIILPLSVPLKDLPDVFKHCQGVLLPGGGDVDPATYHAKRGPKTYHISRQRDRLEAAAIQYCERHSIPVFGICRGLQMLNVAFGGTLLQDIPTGVQSRLHEMNNYPDHPLNAFAHVVVVSPGTRLAHIIGTKPLRTNSRHHQAIQRLAPRLHVNARAKDGIIEGVELPRYPFCLGVQWHPENIMAQPVMQKLFRAFIAAAKKSRTYTSASKTRN